jgi:hypothetical protein
LLFCHLAGCDSLREIDDGLYSACGKLSHLDAKPMKRTTLAYANETRSYRIFEQCYMLLDYFKPMLGCWANKRRKTGRREASGDRNAGAITLVIAGQGLLFASKLQAIDLKGTDFGLCGDAYFQFGQQWFKR